MKPKVAFIGTGGTIASVGTGPLDLQNAATIRSTLESWAPRTETLKTALGTAATDNMARFYRDRLQALGNDDLGGTVAIIGQPLSVTLLNRNSISSLKAIRSLLIDKDVAIADLQFLIDKDGRFVIADPIGMKQGLDESGRSQQASNLREIDALIDTAEVNVSQGPN